MLRRRLLLKSFADLPPELVALVLSFAGASELCSIRLVSRKWRELADTTLSPDTSVCITSPRHPVYHRACRVEGSEYPRSAIAWKLTHTKFPRVPTDAFARMVELDLTCLRQRPRNIRLPDSIKRLRINQLGSSLLRGTPHLTHLDFSGTHAGRAYKSVVRQGLLILRAHARAFNNLDFTQIPRVLALRFGHEPRFQRAPGRFTTLQRLSELYPVTMCVRGFAYVRGLKIMVNQHNTVVENVVCYESRDFEMIEQCTCSAWADHIKLVCSHEPHHTLHRHLGMPVNSEVEERARAVRFDRGTNAYISNSMWRRRHSQAAP